MAKLYQVTLRGEAAGEAFANVLYFESAAKDAEDICTELWANWAGKFAQYLMTNNSKYTSITAKEIGHLILDPDYFSHIADLPGQSGSTTDPQLAICFSLHTGLSGRKRRGRFFHAGANDEHVVNGRLTANAMGACNDLINNFLVAQFLGATPTSGLNLVVFSRAIYDTLQDIILDSYKKVTTITTNSVLSTMRTRKPNAA